MDPHREIIGKGNTTVFRPLHNLARTFSAGERHLPAEDFPLETASKSTAVFEQLMVHEDKLRNAMSVSENTAKILIRPPTAVISKFISQMITVLRTGSPTISGSISIH
jgi:hypothetical protein